MNALARVPLKQIVEWDVMQAKTDACALIGEEVLFGKVERSVCVETYLKVLGQKLEALEKIHGQQAVRDARAALGVRRYVD